MNSIDNCDSLAGPATTTTPTTSRSIDWYAEGESRIVEVDGVRMVVRLVGRKGRRARISIEAPAGAVFVSDSLPGRSP